MHHKVWLNRLILVSLILTLGVILLGAYTRLKDAGLGCPDWPGCYGQIAAPQTPEALLKANAAYPEFEVDVPKAQTEMIHRYFAGTLGLLILIIAVLAYRARRVIALPLFLPLTLVLLVIGQALLGMFTVTLRLNPTIVLLHLLGGLSIISLLWISWLSLRKQPYPVFTINPLLNVFSAVALSVVILQIFLGGWVSTNYAALVCPDFPFCPPFVGESNTLFSWGLFKNAFPLFDISRIPDTLGFDARLAIQSFHRLGAFLTFVCVAGLSCYLLYQSLKHVDPRSKRWLKRIAILLFALLGIQITLGITNVLALLPISVAVLHNGVAVLLLITLITLNFTLYHARH